MGRQELFLPQNALPENCAKKTPERIDSQGLLVMLTGPTGVGKDEALNKLSLPHQRIVTHTTRGQGLNETDGVDYHFTTPSQFETMIEREEMLEYYCNPRGDYYGTSKTELASKRNGDLVVWRLNPDGVFNLLDDPVKVKTLQPLVVICLVADLAILARRVRERGREKGLLVVERAKQASEELFLIERKTEAAKESEEIARRLGAIYDERLFFHNGTGWVDNYELVPESHVAVRVIENKQGLDTPDGFPRTMRLVEETIKELGTLWCKNSVPL